VPPPGTDTASSHVSADVRNVPPTPSSIIDDGMLQP
jgi:hypothetical protein